MFFHTNLLGGRVLIHDDEATPREYWGQEAMIVNAWLDTQFSEPRYTLAVRIPGDPTRPLWNCSHDKFGRQK